MSLISRKEYEEFVKTIPEGACLLCEPQKQIVLGDSKHWIWIANISPYWKYHTMLVPKKHINYFSELNQEELLDFQKFHRQLCRHLLSLELTHSDGKKVNQFLTMFRESTDHNDPSYYKTDHLHIHLVPDERGVDRFNIDPTAIDIDVEKLKLV